MGVEGIKFSVNHFSGLISRISRLIDRISLSLFSGDGSKIRTLLLGGRYLEEEVERERNRLFLSISLLYLPLALKLTCG